VRIDCRVHAREERIEALRRVTREIDGQEVIEEDVGDHAGVVAVLGDENAAECGDRGVGVGEGIDATMIADSFGDARQQRVADPPFDEIASEVSDQRLGAVRGEEEMREIVQADTIAWVLAC